jgi:hypothetical protein
MICRREFITPLGGAATWPLDDLIGSINRMRCRGGGGCAILG